MIRVARIITRLNVGGPAIQAISLSDRLETAGYHTLLIHGLLGEGEGDMSYLLPPDYRFECLHLPALRREISPVSDAAALMRIIELLRQFRPAIVHTHTAKAGALGRLAALLAGSASGGSRARIVHTYHGHVLDGYFESWTAGAFAAAERWLARRSDALVAVSPSVRDDLIHTHRIGDASRFHVVPLGFDLRRFTAIETADRHSARAELGLPLAAHVVAFVGRLTAIKQPEVFLTVAAKLAESDPQVRFLVAGGGDLETSARLKASALGLDERIVWLGWQRDVAPVYAASDVLALTSRNEGTPVAVIEALASSIAVVAFAVGGVPDVIRSPEIGTLVADGDVDAMTSSILALIGDADARRTMGARARVDVAARYGVERLVNDIDGLYRSLL